MILVSVKGCGYFPIVLGCIVFYCDANVSDSVKWRSFKLMWRAYAWRTFKFLWNNAGVTFKHVA